jgi:Sporulation and spore germination
MIPTRATTGPGRHLRGCPAALLALLLLLTGCGVPGDGHARIVADDDVPYHLLDADHSAGANGDTGSVPRLVPVVFWLVGEKRLVPAATRGSCADPPAELADRLLAVLAAGPDQDARAARRSSALPPAPSLRLIGIVDGTAQVEMDPSASISADRLPLAVGQVVLSLASSPGIDRVTFLNAGEPVPVPLPGGALSTRAVSAKDYAGLLVGQYRENTGPQTTLAARVGCQSW